MQLEKISNKSPSHHGLQQEATDDLNYPEPLPYTDGWPDYLSTCSDGQADGYGCLLHNPIVEEDEQISPINHQCTFETLARLTIWTITIILIVVALIGADRFLSSEAALGLGLGPYVIYMLTNVCCSSELSKNLHKIQDYESLREKHVQLKTNRCWFEFKVENYHYEEKRRMVNTKDSSDYYTYISKVVTSCMVEKYSPTGSKDISPDIKYSSQLSTYVEVEYRKRYQFADSESERAFRNAFNRFVKFNRRDLNQSYSHTFLVEGEVEKGVYGTKGDGRQLATWYFMTFLGVGPLYECILKQYFTKYQPKIIKQVRFQ